MKVRKAITSDVERNLLNIFIQGYKLHYENRKDKFKARTNDELKKILEELLTNETIIVLEEKNAIVGYASYQIKNKINKSLWIDEIAIDNKHLGNGYGKILMIELEKISKENSCNSIELCCWQFNNSANEFYEHLGYSIQRKIYEKQN